MTTAPVRHVRRAAGALVEAGATLVAGHSAHVPHEDAAWMRRRFRTACAALGTTVQGMAGRLHISWP